VLLATFRINLPVRTQVTGTTDQSLQAYYAG